jgi:transposase-like protein
MSDAEAEAAFVKVCWPETNGAAVCPKCGGFDAYYCRRPNGAPRFRCRACKKDFSITSGTLFASHKLPPRAYLAAIAIFWAYTTVNLCMKLRAAERSLARATKCCRKRRPNG